MKIRRLRHVGRAAPGNARLSPRARFEIGRSDRARSVVYEAVECGWWLWWPCEACDGAQLPLHGRAAVHGQDRVRLLLACGIVDQPCPRCETRRKRLAPAGAEPAVWYDTWLSDWVLRLPCRGFREGVLLPLEIRWFDAPWADVYRAAADIAYGGDLFHDAP